MQTDRYTTAARRETVYDTGLRNHMLGVYNRMTVGILITAIVAWVVSSSPALQMMFLGGPQAYLVAFAPLAVVWFGFNPASMSSQKLMMSFVAIAVLYGISFSMLALMFAGADIARAFFITSAMFAGLSIFGYTTKKDLTAIGQFCLMAVLGLVLTSVVGMFTTFGSGVQLIINYATIFVFAGVTAFETQRTKQMYHAGNPAEINSRMAWAAALSLYISFVAMFQSILALTSQR